MRGSDSIMMSILDLQDRVEDLEIRDTPSTSATSGSIHAPVTLGGGNDAALALSTQEITLTAVWLRTDGTSSMAGNLNIGDNNITNVGDIALDSISSDAGTSVTVTLGTDAGDDFIVGNNSALVVEGDNDRVGIGNSSPTAKLHVVGSADEQQLIVKAHSTQTNNLTEWQDSSGTVLDSISGTGLLTISPTTSTTFTVADRAMDITKSYTLASGVGTIDAISGVITVTPTTGAIPQISGIIFTAQKAGTGNITSSSSYLRGGTFQAKTNSGTTGNYRELTGGYFISANQSTSGTLGVVSGGKFFVNNISTGTITQASGMLIESLANSSGTVTNNYGLYIDNQSAGTNNYAILTNTGLIDFGDQVKIDGSQDTQQLIVQAHSTQTANLTEWQDSGGTVLTYIEPDGEIAINQDSKAIKFGGGQDATILYDGTDLLIDSQAAGSGHVVLNSPKTTTGDPTGVEGKIYWNTFDNVIKMYADSAWRTLASW
jgi:hypothetical protein